MSDSETDRSPPLSSSQMVVIAWTVTLGVIPILTYLLAKAANRFGVPGECGGYDSGMSVLLALWTALPSVFVLTCAAWWADETQFARPFRVFVTVTGYSIAASILITSGADWCT